MIFHDEPQGAEPARENAAHSKALAAWRDIATSEDGPHAVKITRDALLILVEIAEGLSAEVERIRHQDVHHWLSDGGYSDPTIACGIDVNAIAHRDASLATCSTCRHAAFDRGVLP